MIEIKEPLCDQRGMYGWECQQSDRAASHLSHVPLISIKNKKE